MFGQPSGFVCGMPFRKKPRDGQMQVFNEVKDRINDSTISGQNQINTQLPTGYGKSFVNAGVYSILKKHNKVNRLLVIVPTAAQNEQYIKDAPADLRDACVDGSLGVCDLAFHGIQSLKYHRKASKQVFVATIQSIISGSRDIVTELLRSGNWMITVDEYHHYGIDKAWGQAVLSMPYSFLLAMSATPYRKDDDSAFGKPDIIVSYRSAVKQKCLKPLVGHSYTYKIDAVVKDGEIKSFSTDELIKDVGSCSPEAIEKHRVERQMRWSPKYVSPLVSHPIERMIGERIKTGHKLQAIVGCMCVSHAELVCEQIRAMYPELKIDWVGTGDNGRHPDKNRKIIERFCPAKDDQGRRKPTLDILVHVGMAGEGLDSVNVSEVIHLNKASINNSNNQENGRAARFLEYGDGIAVKGNINFDSSSEYADKAKYPPKGYVGSSIMDAMDNIPPGAKDKDELVEDAGSDEYDPLPDEPSIQIWDMELTNIDSGSPEVARMAKVLAEMAPKYGVPVNYFKNQVGEPESELHGLAMQAYRTMREKECAEFNEKSVVKQWRDAVNGAVNKLTNLVIRTTHKKGTRFSRDMIGDIRKRINIMKKKAVGSSIAKSMDIEEMRKHYKWVKSVETEIIETTEVPSWLQ